MRGPLPLLAGTTAELSIPAKSEEWISVSMDLFVRVIVLELTVVLRLIFPLCDLKVLETRDVLMVVTAASLLTKMV